MLSAETVAAVLGCRYCDCFANGEFCREGCQCHNCKNKVDHAEERARAIKVRGQL